MTAMNYRRLGASGLKVSELSFGSWVTYGNQMGADVARECMAAAYDAGRQFLRQRRGLRARASRRRSWARCCSKLGWRALVVHRVDQVLLGPARRPEREEHAEPQVPDAGDRRLARAPRPRLRRPRVLPSRRSRHADRGNGVRDARHDRRRQGALLGNLGMERGRDHGGVADRRAPSPAQAGDGAAAVQPAAPRARREGIRAPLRATSASARRSGARSPRAS